MKNKSAFFYAIVLGAFSILLWYVLSMGEKISPSAKQAVKDNLEIGANLSSSDNSFEAFFDQLVFNSQHSIGLLLLQIIIIVIFSRVFAHLFIKMKQPSVIGEIIAGIVLGPSLIGMLFPEFSKFLFPEESLGGLGLLSQLGLILFMFIIGMELDVKVLRNKAHAALVVSHASIIFPYFLGVCLSYFLYKSFAPENISFTAFALFMGIAMSITAFPVLARIIQERGMTKTPLGIMAITCAAADDVTAWCILAVVVAIVKAGSLASALMTIGLSVGYVLFMILIVQPFLKKIGGIYISKENLNKRVVAMVFLILLGSSYLTEIIGIHALFGAFLAGVIMPHNFNFKRLLSEKIEDISLVVLLPLFFVLTGLRTEVGLLNSASHWAVLALVILVAILGKFGGSAIASKVVGMNWPDSLSIGALMNTRGLMELVVLNIGYDLGILRPEIFAMMVLMALITTLMTGPTLTLINRFAKKKEVVQAVSPGESFKILISFGPPRMGSTLLKLASQLLFKENVSPAVTALHMTPHSEVTQQEALIYEKEGFSLIKRTAEQLGVKIDTKYKATEDISEEIINQTRVGNYDLLLLGSAKSLFSGSRIGGTVKEIFDANPTNIGVLIDKGFTYAKNILLLLSSQDEKNLVELGLKFINTGAKITVLDIGKVKSNASDFFDFIPQKYLRNESLFQIIEADELPKEFFKSFDLVILGLEFWKKNEDNKENMKIDSSVLIFKSS